MLQGMQDSLHVAPHPSNFQDVLSTWHALKALPSRFHLVNEHQCKELRRNLSQRQPMLLSLADSRADLSGYLDTVAAGAQGSKAVADAVQAYMLAAADELKVHSST